MKYLISILVDISVQRNIIPPSDGPWLQYCLEKWISTILGMGLLLTVGLLLFPPVPTVVFIVSFLFLRQRTNGFHMKSMLGCLAVSLALELGMMGLVYPVLTLPSAATVLVISASLVIPLSPFRHPNFPITDWEFYSNDIGSKYLWLAFTLIATLVIICVPVAAQINHSTPMQFKIQLVSKIEGYTPVSTKNDTSACYFCADTGDTNFLYVRAYGCYSDGSNKANLTYSIKQGVDVDRVYCVVGTPYSIHSTIYESDYRYVMLGLINGGYIYDTYTGNWCGDTIGQYTYAEPG